MYLDSITTQLMTTETKYLLPAIVSVIVSTVVSASIALFVKKYETRDKLNAEYTHDQRKKIRELTGKYHGRLLRAAVSLNHRIWNLYSNEANGWLNADGKYRTNCGYYIISFAHRFLHVASLIRLFEKDAVFLDTRYSKKDDFVFMHYLDFITWGITDVALFDNVPYDPTLQKDHFFSDRIRAYSDLCWQNNDFISHEQFTDKIKKENDFDTVLRFFDGLKHDENRLRWDRIVTIHLIVVSFINKFGYPPQRTTENQIELILSKLVNVQIINNLLKWIPKLGLSKDNEMKTLLRIARKQVLKSK